MVIESSIIPLELVFEHRLYLPSMGLIMLVPGLCFCLPRIEGKKWVTGFIILLIPLLSYWTYERASVWRGSFSLWKDAAQKSPHKSRPHHGLGLAYDDKGMLDEAITELKQSLAIKPNQANAHSNLGAAYDKKGMFDEAIFEYKKALAIKPNSAEVHNNLGLTYENKGMFDEAIFEYKKALTIKPNDAKAHSNLGIVYRKKNRLDEAISEFK
jgi:Flp pilus assembly protein TadD